MEKTKKVVHATPVKIKTGSLKRKHDSIMEPFTDQNKGSQQLYEDQKVRPDTKRPLPATDAKKVRQHSHKKINKLLGIGDSGAKRQKTLANNNAKRTH
jgi:hypothetical protein